MDRHFNPLEYSRELVKAGVSQAQADVHANTLAQVIDQCVAQTWQLEGLKQEVSFKLDDLHLHLRAEFSEALDNLGKNLREDIHRLDRRIDRLEYRIKHLQWANGLIIALLVGLYAQSFFR